MKNRIVALMLTLALCLSLSACTAQAPEDFTQETFDLGNEAVKVMDKYLSGKIDAADAEKQLTEIYDALKVDGESIKPNPDSEDYSNQLLQSMSNSGVSFWISSFVLGMYKIENAFGVIYDCQEMRDSLVSLLSGE